MTPGIAPGGAASAVRRDEGGLYCYVATPYDRRGDVDVGVLREYVGEILRAGVAGITCVASTCEGPYLTEAERDLVVDTVGQAVGGRTRLNVGVGAFSTRQVIEQAARAKDAGATSLMLEMQQYFPVTFDAAYRHYAAVSEAIGLPIRLYNLPLPTRFDFTPRQICAMAGIAGIASVKEASGEVERVREIRLLAGDRFAIYCGFHYQALDGFRNGADGWEVMMHPALCTPLVALYESLRSDPWSKESEARYSRLQPLFHFFRAYGVPQSIKAISQWTALDLGHPRAPFAELPPDARGRLRAIVRELNIL